MVSPLILWSRVQIPQGSDCGPNQTDPVVDRTHQDSKTMHYIHNQLVRKSWISLNRIYIDILAEVHSVLWRNGLVCLSIKRLDLIVSALTIWSRVRVPQVRVRGQNQNDPVVDCTHHDYKTMLQFHHQLIYIYIYKYIYKNFCIYTSVYIYIKNPHESQM